MNERIKKLAEEVGAKELGADLYGGEFIGAVRLDFLEKFAELIIKECVEIIETQRVPVGNSRTGEMAAKCTMDALRECRDAIKEHFGVEP
jgi:hypothetical protein